MKVTDHFTVFLICLNLSFVWGAKARGKIRANAQNRRPNIIFILADDLDVLLGTPEVMSKTRKILREQGTEFDNAFVTTPLCCPSRSSILTGRYVHNHNVHSNNKNCSSQAWRKGPERENFGTFLQTAGYKTGYFGKYLNDYDGTYVPPGWHRWVGLLKNSRFYNYSLNINGEKEYHGVNYEKDYFTDVITRKSIRFFKHEKRRNKKQPLMMVLSMAAPHGPEDAAPQHQNLFEGVRAPRTPNYNYTSLDKHWIVRVAPPLDELRGAFTDLLHRRRLLTTLSLDDAVEKLYLMLKDIGELDNTYIFFSSDHGYHIGQFNLLKGKSQPYETDIRIPLYVRGPGVKGNRRIDKIALNIDLAPTFLDIAGVRRPEFMDGTSLLPLIHQRGSKRSDQNMKWRDSFLVQRGAMVLLNNTLTYLKSDPKPLSRKAWKRAAMVCHRPNRPLPPCTPEKKRVCVEINGVYVLQDCNPVVKSTTPKGKCRCEPIPGKKNLSTIGLKNAATGKKQKKKVLNERQLYQLMMASSSSVEQLRELFKRELARIKRKYRKRSLRYLRHFRFDRNVGGKGKVKQNPWKNITGRVFKQKIQNIDLKIVGARKRLDVLRERKRKLKVKKTPVDEDSSNPKISVLPEKKQTKKQAKCICDSSGDDYSRLEPRRKSKKSKIKAMFKHMKCYYHSKDHWKTPPFWTRGAFSSCKNSPNNTFWCLRTINATHNFIYCEFVTSFVEYYDMRWDPYQLRNTYKTLSRETVTEFQRQLSILRTCKGRLDCTLMNGMTWRQLKEVKTERRAKVPPKPDEELQSQSKRPDDEAEG